jgi:hypothetical protein
MDQIKPCPFCGGAWTAALGSQILRHAEAAGDCPIRDMGMPVEDLARWNMRADDWQPLSTAPRDGTTVQLWHVNWMAPVAAHWWKGGWLEATLTTKWPDEAFGCWKPMPAWPDAFANKAA